MQTKEVGSWETVEWKHKQLLHAQWCLQFCRNHVGNIICTLPWLAQSCLIGDIITRSFWWLFLVRWNTCGLHFLFCTHQNHKTFFKFVWVLSVCHYFLVLLQCHQVWRYPCFLTWLYCHATHFATSFIWCRIRGRYFTSITTRFLDDEWSKGGLLSRCNSHSCS